MVSKKSHPAKVLLLTRGIDDPGHRLRRILVDQAVTLTKCTEARRALTGGANGQQLEAIISGLVACGVDDALALHICGVDDSDAAATVAFRRWREARASKRASPDAEDEPDAGTSAKAARCDGTPVCRSHMPSTVPCTVAVAPPLCTCALRIVRL